MHCRVVALSTFSHYGKKKGVSSLDYLQDTLYVYLCFIIIYTNLMQGNTTLFINNYSYICVQLTDEHDVLCESLQFVTPFALNIAVC